MARLLGQNQVIIDALLIDQAKSTTLRWNEKKRPIRPDVIFFHAPCTDGLSAATVLHQAFPLAVLEPLLPKAELTTDAIERLRDKSILIVDQCFNASTLQNVLSVCAHLDIVDHHASTIDVIAELRAADKEKMLFDKLSYTFNTNETRSAVGLVWEILHPTLPLPWVLRYIQDHDLGKGILPFAPEVCAAVYLLKYQSVECMHQFLAITETQAMLDRIEQLVAEGERELKRQDAKVQHCLSVARRGTCRQTTNGFITVAFAECDELSIRARLSVALSALADVGIAATRANQLDSEWTLSLRTLRDDLDLNVLGRMVFGTGGGHKRIAGATIRTPIDTFVVFV